MRDSSFDNHRYRQEISPPVINHRELTGAKLEWPICQSQLEHPMHPPEKPNRFQILIYSYLVVSCGFQ